MRAFPLEEMKRLLDPDRNFLVIGRIIGMAMAEDRSEIVVTTTIFGEETPRVVDAKMTWNACALGSGIFQLPTLGDLVLLGMVRGDEEQTVVISRYSSTEDTIPESATDGHLVMKSLPGKNCDIMAQNCLNLLQSGTGETQPAVLGNDLKTLLEKLIGEISKLSDALATEVVGAPGSPLSKAVNYATIKTTVDELIMDVDNILSEFVNIEKTEAKEDAT